MRWKMLVVDKYDGSLKAEHGTGRNMALRAIRMGRNRLWTDARGETTLIPKDCLTPALSFNDDPKCHIRNFKPLTLTNAHVDKMHRVRILRSKLSDVGFTLSSRQRIVIQREISRLKTSQEAADRKEVAHLGKQYQYLGNQTCAGDGLCSLSCPMGINTATWHTTSDKNSFRLTVWVTVWESCSQSFLGNKMCFVQCSRWPTPHMLLLGSGVMSTLTKKHAHAIQVFPNGHPPCPKPTNPRA